MNALEDVGILSRKERAFSCDALSSLKLSLVTGRDIFESCVVVVQ